MVVNRQKAQEKNSFVLLHYGNKWLNSAHLPIIGMFRNPSKSATESLILFFPKTGFAPASPSNQSVMAFSDENTTLDRVGHWLQKY
jgi:hypothetical protein